MTHKFIKTPVITETDQLKGLRRGQWIKLAWCDTKSRFDEWTEAHVRCFHNNGEGFIRYHRGIKASLKIILENRTMRSLLASGL